jgi:hypothetical protein
MKSKTKQTQSTRKHGLSRLEKLLQASIRQELQIKALWRVLREHTAKYTCSACGPMINDKHAKDCTAVTHGTALRILSDSSEVWPWKPPGVYGGGSGLDRNKP